MKISVAHVWSIESLRTGDYLSACSVPVALDLPVWPVLGVDRRSPAPQHWQNHRRHPLPTDFLIDLEVRCSLALLIPVYGWLNRLTHQRHPTAAARVPVWCAAALFPPRCAPVFAGCRHCAWWRTSAMVL